MKIRFWGTRGSIAQSNYDILRYGGHTSCVEIRSNANDLLVLDAGTGLRQLSKSLLTEKTPLRSSNILISHTHWDHIQGLPFFTPFFLPNHQWGLFGPSTLAQDLESILHGQMQQTYFPITPDIFNANMNYHTIGEGSFEVGDIKVTTCYLNHPGVTLGYRIEVDGYVIVYATDHEPHDCRLAHGGLPLKGSEDAIHGDFLAQADYVIHDTQYLAKEYDRFRGWGHSTMEYVVDLAHSADVKNLVMFHHDPSRSDREVDQMIDMAYHRLQGRHGKMEVLAASEHVPIIPSQSYKIQVAVPTPPRYDTDAKTSVKTICDTMIMYSSFDQNERFDLLINAIVRSQQKYRIVSTQNMISTDIQHCRPPLIFLKLQSFEELEQCYTQIFNSDLHELTPTIILLCKADQFINAEQLSTLSPLPIRLVEPISEIYLSSRIQTWLHRFYNRSSILTHTWMRAKIPLNDLQRSHVATQVIEKYQGSNQFLKNKVQKLITLARQMMMTSSHQVMTVALNIITADRQESIMSDPKNSSLSCARDFSFCSHVIAQDETLCVLDTTQHQNFKYLAHINPDTDLTRSYIGIPLYVSHFVIGTLCCFSTHVIQIQDHQLESLQQIATMIEDEFTEHI